MTTEEEYRRRIAKLESKEEIDQIAAKRKAEKKTLKSKYRALRYKKHVKAARTIVRATKAAGREIGKAGKRVAEAQREAGKNLKRNQKKAEKNRAKQAPEGRPYFMDY